MIPREPVPLVSPKLFCGTYVLQNNDREMDGWWIVSPSNFHVSPQYGSGGDASLPYLRGVSASGLDLGCQQRGSSTWDDRCSEAIEALRFSGYIYSLPGNTLCSPQTGRLLPSRAATTLYASRVLGKWP